MQVYVWLSQLKWRAAVGGGENGPVIWSWSLGSHHMEFSLLCD